MWDLAVCGVLIVAGVFLTYLAYRELKTTAELSKTLNALDEEIIRASKILNDLQKGKEGKE